MYHEYKNVGRGISDCSFTMRAIQNHFPNIVSSQMAFVEEITTREDFRHMLKDIKKRSRSESKARVCWSI